MENTIIEFIASLLGSFIGYLTFTRLKINAIEIRMDRIEKMQEAKRHKLDELDKDIQKLSFSFENLAAMIKIILTKLQPE